MHSVVQKMAGIGSTIYAVLPLPERAMLFRYSNRVWAVCYDRGARSRFNHIHTHNSKRYQRRKGYEVSKGKEGKNCFEIL